MKNRRTQMVAWLLALLLVVGMTPDMGAVQAAKKVALNKKKITLQVGASTKLKVKNTKKKVTWKTSNKKIVKVNKTGKVTALKKGNAKITAKVAGKKLICKVKVVPKNTTETGTTEATTTTPANNTDTPSTPAAPTPSDQKDNNNKQDNTKQDNDKKDDGKQDNKNDTDKSLKLSDITFKDGYSTQMFTVNIAIPVDDYHDYPYTGGDNEDEFACDDEVVGCIGHVRYSFEDETGTTRYVKKLNGSHIHIVKQGNGYVLKAKWQMRLGNYKILCNGLCGRKITKDDFTDLTYTEEDTDGDAEFTAHLKNFTLPKVVSVRGQLFDCNGQALETGYVTVKQTVDGKEYTQVAEIGDDDEDEDAIYYCLQLMDGQDYTIIPMGLEDEAFEISVKNGQIYRKNQTNLEKWESYDIKLKTSLQTVSVKEEGFDEDSADIELRSGNTVIKRQDIGTYDEAGEKWIPNYVFLALPGTYDVYYGEYLIQKGLEIKADTTSVTITNPTYPVFLKMDGEDVQAEDYRITKGGSTIENFDEDEVGVGTYRIYQNDSSYCIGEFRVDAGAADADGNIIWNISKATVTLMNFEETKDLSDYIVKVSKEEEEEEVPIDDPQNFKLCAGRYTVYVKTEEGEAGEECGTFEITLDDAKKGTVTWQMDLAEITGRIEIPDSFYASIRLAIYKKTDQSGDSRYEKVKTVDCGALLTHSPTSDEIAAGKGYSYRYIDSYKVHLPKGEYVFQVLGQNSYERDANFCNPAVVTVDQKKMQRDIMEQNVTVALSASRDLSGLSVRFGDYRSYGSDIFSIRNNTVSTTLDCNSTYDLYVCDNAYTMRKIDTKYNYNTCKDKTIPLDDAVLSKLHSYELTLDETKLETTIGNSEVLIKKGIAIGACVKVENNKCTVQLFEDGEYTIWGLRKTSEYGGTYDKELGTLTLKNGVFQYTPVQ